MAVVPAGPPNSYLNSQQGCPTYSSLDGVDPRLMLVELLVHLLSVLSGHRIDLHQRRRLAVGDFLRVGGRGRLALSQVARWTFAHRDESMILIDDEMKT